MPMTGPEGGAIAEDIDDAAQDWFLLLSSGEATEADLRAFATWRDADPRHAAAYAEMRELWNDVAPLESAFAPRGHQAAHPVGHPAVRHAAFWRGPWLAGGFAAGLALFALIALFPTGLFADHRSGVGGQSTVTLPDGSIAHLNTDTAIDVDYSDGKRRIELLRGEAFFEVRKDATRPFVVEAEGGRTTAVGTAFTVHAANDGAIVTVTEGTVRVDASTDAAGQGALVTAGHQVRYGRGGNPGPLMVRDLDPSAEIAWLRGQIVIRDRPLADALAEIGRYRPGRIVLARDEIDLQPLTARLALSDLDGGIDALAATYGLSVTRLTPYLVILR